jgi:DNA-directed RNA polymerase subunit beta'
MEVGNKKFMRLEVTEEVVTDIKIPASAILKVKNGAEIKRGDVFFIDEKKEEHKAQTSGTVEVENNVIAFTHNQKEIYEYPITSKVFLRVKDGDKIVRGQQITEGQLNIKDLMKLRGLIAAERYVISEIQKIYSLQGQNINDKHVEAVVRQMFSKVRIEKEGDSDFIAGEIIEKLAFEQLAVDLAKAGKTPPTASQLLLGISKAALNTESFLSAASFQETTRVLVDAAVTGKVDYLRGLKENVIVGRLIPAGTGFKAHNRVDNQPGSSV